MRTGHGLKGDRHYDWAMLDVLADDTPEDAEPGHSYLLVRRHRYTRELSFYCCHSSAAVTMAVLVDVVCCRWKIEEIFRPESPTAAWTRARPPAGTPGCAGA
jgi:hypothetical protein